MIYKWKYEAPSPEQVAAAQALAAKLGIHPALGKLLVDRGLDDEAAAQFMKLHLQWHIDKLTVPENELPEVGDQLLIEIPSSAIWMVEK